MSVTSFITELKRRRVFRVGAVYAAAAYVVLEASDLMLPRLGVPDWVISLMVLLALAGFVLAVALAWAFEFTPEGIKRTGPHRGDAEQSNEPVLGTRSAIVAVGLVVLGVGVGAGWFLKPNADVTTVPTAEAAEPDDNKSVAVLPFDDMSPGKDQAWFSDGLTEEILNSLARLEEIRVTARNSSFQFKGRAVDVREVGRQLGVANVVEGSVRRAGDQLRITAQLIRTADGFHLWSNTYDRHLDDVFAVQLDIAENIARVLDVYLDASRRERMVASGTRDPAAFVHYMRGRAAYNEAHKIGVGTSDLLWQANVWFARALEADPGYALARFYHHDAFSHALMSDLRVPPEFALADGSPDVARLTKLMNADLDKALADAGNGALARSLAVVRQYNRGEWDRLPAAVANLDVATIRQELEIAGGGWLWFPLMILREEEQTRNLARWRLKQDPLEVNSWSDMISLEIQAGRFQESQRLLDEAARHGLQHRYLEESHVLLLLAVGRAHEVLNVHAKRMESMGNGWWAAAMAHAQLGNVTAARAEIKRGLAAGDHDERTCWILARIGDQGAANDCARAIDGSPQGWIRLGRMIVDHGSIPFDPNATPKFTAMYNSTGARPWPRTQPVAVAAGK